MIPRLIIAGITNLTDAKQCLELGVDGISFIFYSDPRQISMEKACEISKELPPFFPIMGEFMDRQLERVKTIQRVCRLTSIRLTGSENNDYFRRINCKILKTVRLKPGEKIKSYDSDTLFYDLYIQYRTKNDGKRIHLWNEAEQALKLNPLSMLSGNIDMNSIKKARTLKPLAIRINSGAEQFIGKKDPGKITKLLKVLKTG